MANTVADLIDEAFIDLAVIQPGETISADMLANTFRMINQLISSWSGERLVNPNQTHGNFTPVAGTSSYTFGAGGTFNTAAVPVQVTGWSQSSGNFSNGGKIISYDEFRTKTLNATARRSVLAELVTCDQNYPLMAIEMFPPPDTAPGTLRLDYYMVMTAFAATSTTVNLPPAYEQALHFNLAVAMAPQYARSGGVTPELAANAQNSKAVIVQKNADILGIGQAQQAA